MMKNDEGVVKGERLTERDMRLLEETHLRNRLGHGLDVWSFVRRRPDRDEHRRALLARLRGAQTPLTGAGLGQK